jgi:sulfatase maturation enzyme AslB (radical SAM superfamily)
MDVLRKIYVEPTNACNLNCRTCVRHAWGEPEGFMKWSTHEAAIDALRGAISGIGGTVALMGLGEPLLHPRFLDMVRLAKQRGLRVEVTTNALLLTPGLTHGLLNAGLDQLVVSIDGVSAESFGRARSGASLDKVITNVRGLHDRRGPNYGSSIRIGIEFVVMRSNMSELAGLNQLAAQLGASFIIVSNVLAYTPELVAETLYDYGVTSTDVPETAAAPAWQLPKFDWDPEIGAILGQALQRAGAVPSSRARLKGQTTSVPLCVRMPARSPSTAASVPVRPYFTVTHASYKVARRG